MSASRSALDLLSPTATHERLPELCSIWDSVADLIVQRSLDLAAPQMPNLHINLREEMILEFARLTLAMARWVVEDRLSARALASIVVEQEREECFGEKGMARIDVTARLASEHIWLRRYSERWEPKTRAMLEREKNPKTTKLVRKEVHTNHYIPKSFLRTYWAAANDKVLRFRRADSGDFTQDAISFGRWGHRENLYGDRLEAYFGLIEGDALPCIEKLLRVEPLNMPQKQALVGFIVIQWLRNPHFMSRMNKMMKPVVEKEVGLAKSEDAAYMRSVYETLYQNNRFYDQVARPILWSRWVVVRSQCADFVLPDTSVVMGTADTQSYAFVPLTPTDCLIVLPTRAHGDRPIPHYVQANPDLTKRIASVLVANVQEEFIAHPSFKAEWLPHGAGPELIREVLATLAQQTGDM